MLRSGPVQVIEQRASIVLGSGSLSFELIRALSERLPPMVMPRWVTTDCGCAGGRQGKRGLIRIPETDH